MACRSEPWEAFNYIIIIMSHSNLPQISGAPNFDYFSLKEKEGGGGDYKRKCLKIERQSTVGQSGQKGPNPRV